MILDATCGLKEMWFQKDAEDVVYLDMRHGAIAYTEDKFKLLPELRNQYIKPTIIGDNRNLPFKNNSFTMVLYDPPHIISKEANDILSMKYSVLSPITWTMDMSSAIKELFRVLKPNGFFVFKWSEHSRALKEALKLFPYKPLFGTNVSYKNKTWWIVFRKDSR